MSVKYDWRWSAMQPLLAEVRRIQDGVYLKSYANGSGGVSDSYGQDLLLFDADQDPLAVIRDWIEKHRPWPRCEQNNNSGVIVVYRDTTTIGEAYYRDGKPKPDCDAMYQWSCENRDGWHWLPDGVEPNVIREHREHEAAKAEQEHQAKDDWYEWHDDEDDIDWSKHPGMTRWAYVVDDVVTFYTPSGEEGWHLQ